MYKRQVLAVLVVVLALANATVDGTVLAYVAGNWLSPFGIVLAVDRLTIVMLLVATLAVLACLSSATDGEDTRAPHFHALLCLQLAGPVSYTHLRAHETVLDLVCRLLLEKKKCNDTANTSPLMN